jgi:serine/threonine protein kinase
MSIPAETIFFAALEKPTAAERAAYLDEACRGDAELRRRVERLLQAHPNVGSFMQDPLPGHDDATQADDPEADDTREVADLLAPSQKPGSLGRLDHYEVLEIVGRGGMGVVLKGFDEKLHRVVAIKVMARDLAASATARKRFTREARAAAAVSHDHVVTIHAVEDGYRPPYLVMQFVEGVSLQEKLDNQGVLGLKETLRIGLQTAQGLAAAHRQGLVHRDIKPANILLENGVERVKITDFGLARAVDDAGLTQSRVITGTPMYMSPEQAAGQAVDHRSDLFSFGSVLYAMCTGEPPFGAGGTHGVIRRVIEDAPRPIPELNPQTPAWLCDLVGRLHAKDPADRPESAQEVAEVLGEHLAQAQKPTDAAKPVPSRKSTGARRSGKRRWIGAAAALVLLALGVAFAAQRAGWLARSHHTFQSNAAQPSVSAGERPADKAVLDELRRLASIQQENLRRVRVNYEVQRVSRIELSAAEAELLEARIKLAAAERQPVVPLLQDLVRLREDVAGLVRARVDFGAEPEAAAHDAERLLSEARLRLAEARAKPPATTPTAAPSAAAGDRNAGS